MNNIIIFLFILIANVVSILLIYHSFDKNIEKTKRFLYAMISMGLMYIVVLIIYFFSSIGLPKETVQKSKDMITFTFVPVNSIILVPFLLRSFYKRKRNEITTEQLNRRAIITAIVGIVLIIGEFFYFKNIEEGIVNIVNQKQSEQNAIAENVEKYEEENDISNNTMLNNLIENKELENSIPDNDIEDSYYSNIEE